MMAIKRVVRWLWALATLAAASAAMAATQYVQPRVDANDYVVHKADMTTHTTVNFAWVNDQTTTTRALKSAAFTEKVDVLAGNALLATGQAIIDYLTDPVTGFHPLATTIMAARGISGTTATLSGTVTANGGVTGTTMTLSGVSTFGNTITASKGMSGTTATLSGDVILSALTASTVPYMNANQKFVSSSVTPTELGYLSGVTSSIQTQIDTIMDKAPAWDAAEDQRHTTTTLSAAADALFGLAVQEITVDNQAINLIVASPASGSAGPIAARAMVDADIPAGIARDTELPVAANPTATITDSIQNGSAATFMRSDAAPKLPQALAATATPTFAGLTIDNLTLDGNTLSSTNTNGDVNIGANGTGKFVTYNVNGQGTQQRWSYTGGSTIYLDLVSTYVASGVMRHSFNQRTGGTVYTDVLNIDRGKVGFGTAAPATAAHVASATNTPLTVEDTVSDGIAYVGFRSAGTAKGYIGYNNLGSKGLAVVNAAGDTVNLMVADAGNVGIGTNAPATKLDVAGTATVDNLTLDNGGKITRGVYVKTTVCNYNDTYPKAIATLAANETVVAVYVKFSSLTFVSPENDFMVGDANDATGFITVADADGTFAGDYGFTASERGTYLASGNKKHYTAQTTINAYQSEAFTGGSATVIVVIENYGL